MTPVQGLRGFGEEPLAKRNGHDQDPQGGNLVPDKQLGE